MNYLLLILSAQLALTNSTLSDLEVDPAEWKAYKSIYAKSYSASEDTLRSLIYAQRKQEVKEFNDKTSKKIGFQLSLNHLADLSDIELKAMNSIKYSGEPEDILVNSPAANRFIEKILSDDSIEVPDQVDWRKVRGRVVEFKSKGYLCSSSWAFAATSVLEGQEIVRKANNGTLIELSEQNLIDCDATNHGCAGGNVAEALNFVASQGGIQDALSYPYFGVRGRCRYNKSRSVITNTGSAILPSGDEEALKRVVAKFGPVATTIDGSSVKFSLYYKGIYYNKDCHKTVDQLNHALLIVGYGADPKYGDYWIVQNWYAEWWGQEGFGLIARNRDNACGIATVATIPTF